MRRVLLVAELGLLLSEQPAWCQSIARQAGYLFLSPMPAAPYVSAQTRFVLVRLVNVAPAQVTNLTNDFITVIGAASGFHSGTTRVATDGRTVVFQMDAEFSPEELVTVDLDPQLASGTTGNAGPFEYQFMTTAPMPGSLPLATGPLPPRTGKAVGWNTRRPLTPSPLPFGRGEGGTSAVYEHSPGFGLLGKLAPTPVRQAQTARSQISATPASHGKLRKARVMSNGVSVPSDFPNIAITVNNNPSPGYLFLENSLDGVPPYTVMLDNSGLPVWYRQGSMHDFKIQKNGMITWAVQDDTGFPAFDQNFNYLKTYLTTNGYLTDSHELKVLPDGSYFMIGYRTNAVDLGQYIAGELTAIVRETVVQGFTAADELIFQWRAWDHYDIRDLGGNSDFPHMNGIDVDEDGNILVSARHLSEVTKIDRDSGDIIWHLSGPHSSFTFLNDPFNGTSFQHNISSLGNGHYMVFDNGDGHVPQVSRAVEYRLDLTNRTATMTWQFRDSPDKYAFWLGSAQRLPTGNTLINFVRPPYPKAIEVDSNGVKRFELSMTVSSDSYRAFRFPWNGLVAAPYLVVEPQADNVTLLFNKFGDSKVAYYRIYGGTTPHPTNLIAQSDTTLKQLASLQNHLYFFRVTSVSTDGTESPFSNEESVNVNITLPGQNMVQNGDFSQGSNSWLLAVSGAANAGWAIENGASHFYITNSGAALNNIQLIQGNVSVITGNQYVLEFDAWSDQARYIQSQVAQSASPFIDYSGLAATFVTPNRARYRYVFSMEYPSDFSARLLFDLGGSSGAVYLDNILLFSTPVGDLNRDGRVDLQDLDGFCGNWLKLQGGLAADLDANGKVDFFDFVLLGSNWGAGTP